MDPCKHCGACQHCEPCDHCGHCRKCGKPVPYRTYPGWIYPTPIYPVYPTYPVWPPVTYPWTVTCGSSSSTYAGVDNPVVGSSYVVSATH